MTELLTKKLFYRLILLLLITTPLFGLLGGTPFLTFDFKELNIFLPGIYFVAVITFLFWVINISLLVLSEKVAFLKKIILRSIISVVIGMAVSTSLFYFFQPVGRQARMHFEAMKERERANGDTSFYFEGKRFEGEQRWHEGNRFESTNRASFNAMPPGSFAKSPRRFFFFPQIVRSLTINLIILTLCELVFLYYRKQKIETENARLKQSNLEARNNQLRMQLHPHFLFNSLNTLRLLLKKDADKAEDYLVKLSEMLRFSTTTALQPVVDVEDELKLCLSYLQMQKVRFGDMLHFTILNPALYEAKGKLPVYSLQLLAENAIKHNTFTVEKPLFIFIDYNDAEQTITVKNKLQPRKIAEATTKTGLLNLQERYLLLSNEGITITDNGNEFAVSLKIL